MALFLIGCLFLFLATCFLPLIVVAPQKTANFVNVGSLCILASIGLIRGFYQFFVTDLLFHKTRWAVSWGYLVSVVATFYCSVILKSYLATLATIIVEVGCLLYFICGFFPGGRTGMKYMLKLFWAGVKSVFNCCVN